ncbi:tryptophan 2,3-dioxygenase [Lysobacter concretionis Ko07 = DSM 16239]|uniref:Tryptophan 2,3-dioxygenase n=1 Tax=Lysobacter concretionis Ko07 = DSM 16239 TaxID=1122185 RepID=A0A0A0ER41_9GAMM|nr:MULTISPECIES: tryptophan 2,3-dioxygenase family protein [Lysobacter]KGM52904.1 tryptophan 2,3-dioxygenase [Lysobacter concretionis Ko07 = DSM 16239]QOD91340.1 tryptophan 2,3-dioxygenase [Lysobacter sp. CW239]
MTVDTNERELESGIHTDLSGRMSYAGYLQLDRLLSAQNPLSNPVQHDELLFIVQHQVSELWMKLMIHELKAAIDWLRADDVGACQKSFSRCKQVLRQLTEMWSVLETLTPSDYMRFRDILGPSSGFQSLQYREMEFLLGNKNAAMLQVFAHDPAAEATLRAALETPSLYDEALRYLGRQGHAVPAHLLERDWTRTHVSDPGLLPVFERIYEDHESHWQAYHLCEDLVDLESQFQLWRFRHMRTVLRIIGFKRGTGGSSGVGFLKQALELTFFPELFEVRTLIGPGADYGSCPAAPGA